MKKSVILMCLVLLLATTSFAYAHEFILVPQQWQSYHEGQKLPFSLASSHSFMRSEELEAAESVAASYDGSDVTLYPNKPYFTWDGSVTLKSDEAAVISAHRKGEVWSKTTTGWKKGDKSTLQGVILTRKYEKFAKSILPVDGNTAKFDRTVGHLLEIVPVDNPLTACVGDDIRVKVLFDGKPVAPENVFATYKGFTDTENTYAYTTEPYGDGIAKIHISNSGLWMVRVQHVAEGNGDKYESHIIRATLTFPIAK
ncbi:DUF4198 domain-containing protein [Halodesulfovibrio marinisediminis]|uniref:Uncharacterized conserved protein, contains GH25 family domain n=1 Tax=Halodesulfovibrio marinisediminis DSM 17456 TaxID=1121457 RepID=A0A1N6FNX8_9BACT|nr:DUF4198 domain-containing protein [Halodesulfovibrio marinisediminis]SIN96944.1 Uncharacterized conserved protein, contains GH25 family domain [Halodesulfovibrio marinisediminis DSM 17456]